MDDEMKLLLENRKRMEDFTVLLSEVLKETDDEKVKEEAKAFLGEISQAYRFFVVGSEKTGRTTLFRNCFLERDEQYISREETEGIWELRYGAQDMLLQVEEGYHRKFITNAALDGLVLVDVGSRDFYKTARGSELAKSADVILAVFSADNIQDDYIWDFIEKNAVGKKVVCILTKADQYPPEIIENKKKKLLGYMKDIHLTTPVFAVSDQDGWQDSYEEVKDYIRRSIIGLNPAEQKKQSNFYALAKTQNTLKASVEKRSQQYAEDQRILAAMETHINEFYDVQEEKIKVLKAGVVQIIREEIQNYQDSILRQFDPRELHRNPNTENKKVFMDWLRHEVNRYETILNNRVSEQTNKVMRQYIAEIDEICMELQDYLKNRKNFLNENDSFYGSLAKSRTTIVKRTQQVALASHEDYMTLLAASEELFNKVWADRRKRDLGVAATATAASVVAGAGGVAGLALVLSSSLTLPWIVVGALVLGTAGYEAGKKLGELFFDGKLIENTEKYIGEFKENIAGIKDLMESKTLEKLDELFNNEFQLLDKNLLQFRTMTNIDARNVPLLESKMQEMESLLMPFMKEKNTYEYR